MRSRPQAIPFLAYCSISCCSPAVWATPTIADAVWETTTLHQLQLLRQKVTWSQGSVVDEVTDSTADKAAIKQRHKMRPPNWLEANRPACSTVTPHSKVLTFGAGTWARCATVTVPPESHGPMPIFFWFHAAGGDSTKPQCARFSELGLTQKFIVVCAEALQGVFRGGGGYWSLPEIVTDGTGNECNHTNPHAPGGADLSYMLAMLEKFEHEPKIYDVSRLFFAGCSMGSHFSMYVSTCIKQKYPQRVSAFATHSSGLKVKGDGLSFPTDMYDPEFGWGECPNCQYAPIKPQKFDDTLGLKACIFDNTGDLPDFYWSSINLAEEWLRLGNKVELHAVSAGVHCEIKDYNEILQCLDDDTGRLQGKQSTETLLNAQREVLVGATSARRKRRELHNRTAGTSTSGKRSRGSLHMRSKAKHSIRGHLLPKRRRRLAQRVNALNDEQINVYCERGC